MAKNKGLIVTFAREGESGGFGVDEVRPSLFVWMAPGKHRTVDSVIGDEHSHEYLYRFLQRAGLPDLGINEVVTVRVRIKRAKAGRPKQQVVAVG